METDSGGTGLTYPMPIVVDSSVFVSSLSPSDSTCDISQKFLSKLGTQEVILPTLVLAEVATVLHRIGYTKILTVVRNISAFAQVPLDQEFIDFLLARLPKMPPIKTADMIIVCASKEKHATLVTWDRQLLKLPKKICEVVTPEAYLRDQKN